MTVVMFGWGPKIVHKMRYFTFFIEAFQYIIGAFTQADPMRALLITHYIRGPK